jgi:hypothetical protein
MQYKQRRKAMKNLITVIILTLIATAAHSADIYAEAYRFDEVNHTGVLGFQGDHFGGEISVSDGKVSLTNRQYLEFTNIEIGVSFELSNGHQSDAVGYRVIDIEGGWHLMPQPYIKVGSELFATVKLDESNSPVIAVGFKLF